MPRVISAPETQACHQNSSGSASAVQEEVEETDDDDNENRSHKGSSNVGHNVGDGRDNAEKRDADKHGGCAEGEQEHTTNGEGDRPHTEGAMGEKGGDQAVNHQGGHIQHDSSVSKEGGHTGLMDIDIDGGCTSGHDGTTEGGVASKDGEMDVDMDGGCKAGSLGCGGNVNEGAAKEGEYLGPMDVDMDGSCGDGSLGCDKNVGQGAAKSGISEQPLPAKEPKGAEKRMNPPREAKEKKDEPSHAKPRPQPKPKPKPKRKLKSEPELKPRLKPVAESVQLIERNYFEEIEFGDSSRLVDMIDLTQDMVSCSLPCNDMAN
jgi:hypothetical protein